MNPRAQSAVSRTLEWTDLENRSLATLSKNFTVAVYASKENTFPTVWENKDKNGKRFLTDCGFDENNIFVSSDFNAPTGKDTLGYIFGMKKIEVYDQKTQQNKKFTLVAVGIRGGGYGAEWASNLTIGNSNGPAAQSSGNSLKYRHYGFDYGAQKVLSDLRTYTSSISGDVKYWVVGYSRAGAVANLVAGDLTKNAAQYKTSMDDVYGYTFEAPAAALISEEAATGTRYPNIHNVINPMDAVPMVSPSEFNHCRLGMDYRLPFHGNVTDAENQAYYANMQTVLPMVAAIAPLYDRDVTGYAKDKTDDPSVTNSATYPYRSKIEMKSFGITNYDSGFVETVSNSNVAPPDGWYMDEFLKSFVTKFFSSRAWDARKLKKSFIGWNAENMHWNDHAGHEYEYVKYYQEALRTLAYAVLKQPGMDLGSMDGLMDNATANLNFRDYLDGAGLLVSYGIMDASHGNIGYESSVGNMIDPMGRLLNSIVDDLGVFEAQDLDDVHAAIKTVIPVLTWLYCDDHTFDHGEYLGTAFANAGTILSAHSPELTVSWLMSLDDVFISDYREITLPKNTAVSMKVLRAGIDYTDESELQFLKANGAKNADIPGVEVAAFVNGVKTISRDDRITVADSGDNMVIRYPGNLDVRFDVQAAGEGFADLPLTLTDWDPAANVVNVKSTCTRAGANDADGLNESNIKTVGIDHAMTTQANTPDANAVNGLTAAIPLSGSETLHIMSWHGSNQVAGEYDTTYYVSLDKAPRSVVAEYTMETVLADNVRELPADTDEQQFAINAGGQLVWTGSPASQSETYAKTGERSFTAFDLSALGNVTVTNPESVVADVYSTRQTVSVVPAANIYYDDTLLSSDKNADARTSAPNYENAVKAITAAGTPVTADSLVAFKFTGTRVDLYMNTTSADKFVSAYILDENGNQYVQDGVKTSMLVTGKSANALSNVPVVSFTGLNRGTYTLAVVAPSQTPYTLDGVRVYDESRASYASVRETLLGTADWTGDGEAAGTVYLDYGQNGEARKADYTAAGPKGEVYLQSGNGVAFAIADYDSSVSYRIGLAAASGSAVTVYINGEEYTASPTHMFYDLHPNENGFVVISGVSGGILSVTDVEAVAPVRSLRLMASPALMRFAASLSAPAQPEETAEPTPEVTPEVTPEPTPEATPEPTTGVADAIRQLISSFVQSLFGSISRMFGH